MRRTDGRWAVLCVLAMACGGGSSYGGGSTSAAGTPVDGGTQPAATAFTITISGLRFSPLNLAVPPGATVTVVNNDNMPHSVTSEAAPGSFTRGAVAGISFDTGEFSSGSRTFTIPTTAAAGTVVPYFCLAHLGTMGTPNGSITIDPTAKPNGASADTSSPTMANPYGG